MAALKLTYDETVARVRANLCTSAWLRLALLGFDRRDPLDALNDAHQLLSLAKKRFDEVVALSGEAGYIHPGAYRNDLSISDREKLVTKLTPANTVLHTPAHKQLDPAKQGACLGDVGHAEAAAFHEDPAVVARWEAACRR